MTPSKPRTGSISIGIGVAPKPKSPLPTGRNPFEDLMKGATSGGTGSTSLSDVAQPSGKENVLGQAGAKASRDDAGFIGEGQWCGCCTNYTVASKECSKVDGQFEIADACKQYFEPLPGHEEDDDEGTDLLAGMAGGGSETTPTSLT